MSNRAKRIALFHRGADALARYTGGRNIGNYACPLCQALLGLGSAESGELTLEDVPPKSLGGRGLVLTCRDCNNTAGHQLDAHAYREDAVWQFGKALSGEGEIPRQRAQINVHGEQLNAEVRKAPGEETITLDIQSRINDPAAVQRSAARAMAEQGLGGGDPITITPGIRWQIRRARISGLKTSYLLGFALWGYSFAFHRHLDSIREQIRYPGRKILPAFWLTTQREPVEIPEMVLITHPLNFLLVWLQGMAYILPVPWGPEDLYAAATIALAAEHTATKGIPLKFPEDCPMHLDFRGTEA